MSDPNAVNILAKALADFAVDVLASYDVQTADCHTNPEFHEVCRESAVYLCAKFFALTPPAGPAPDPAAKALKLPKIARLVDALKSANKAKSADDWPKEDAK